uniref:Bifunctional inhibitor/plant lipid transfer protein/seed storage helical domain-containing protein n=1 Tax=Leersia perrieri TaxID=77586 RepID=A0A0D9WYL5_9ORYZ
MVSSKCILLAVFALFAIASLQPSAAARDSQMFYMSHDAVRQEQEAPKNINVADVDVTTQPSTSPGLPGLPPLPPIPSIQIPPLPPLPQIPSFQIPTLPPLPPIPSFQIPTLPPLPPIPSFQIPTLPPLPSLPTIQIPGLPPLPSLPTIQIPGLPPLPILPNFQIPRLPPLPPLPALTMPVSPGSPAAPQVATSFVSAPAQPTECLTSLMELMPCIEYLTKTDVPTPPTTCCDGFKSLVEKAPICLCHGINGNINNFTPAPIDFMRMMSLPATCGVTPPLEALANRTTSTVDACSCCSYSCCCSISGAISIIYRD